MSQSAISQTLGGGPSQHRELDRLKRRLLRPRSAALLEEPMRLATRSVGITGPTVQPFSERHNLPLTPEDQRVIAQALLDPPEPGPKLLQAIERYKKIMNR